MISPRLCQLHLRSRLAGGTTLALAGVAAAIWGLLRLGDERPLTTLVLTIMPLALALPLGLGLRSPFGEVEESAGTPLPLLRLGHLAALLAVVALACTLAATADADPASRWTLLRNSAGQVGLVLLAGRLVGLNLAWPLPVTYLLGTYAASRAALIGDDSPLLWPVLPAYDRPAVALVAVVLLAGLGLVSRWGPRREV